MLKHFTNLFIYNCAVKKLKKALEKLPEGCAVTFVVDACFAGGLIEMASEKIVLLTACRTHEESSGGNLGSVFANPFLELIGESSRLNNDSYPTVTNRELIRRIRLRFMRRGCLQTPGVFSTQAKANSPIFRCFG